eukprot:scaffold118515_cov28-Tisochrysis_lutea.AAC.4
MPSARTALGAASSESTPSAIASPLPRLAAAKADATPLPAALGRSSASSCSSSVNSWPAASAHGGETSPSDLPSTFAAVSGCVEVARVEASAHRLLLTQRTPRAEPRVALCCVSAESWPCFPIIPSGGGTASAPASTVWLARPSAWWDWASSGTSSMGPTGRSNGAMRMVTARARSADVTRKDGSMSSEVSSERYRPSSSSLNFLSETTSAAAAAAIEFTRLGGAVAAASLSFRRRASHFERASATAVRTRASKASLRRLRLGHAIWAACNHSCGIVLWSTSAVSSFQRPNQASPRLDASESAPLPQLERGARPPGDRRNDPPAIPGARSTSEIAAAVSASTGGLKITV